MSLVQDNTVQILQHRVSWKQQGEATCPATLDQTQLEHIEHMIRSGFNQGELRTHDHERFITHRGWWQISAKG